MVELRGENNAPSNKSMDVRAKQRLSYYGVLFPFTCVAAVSPHVISIVGHLLVKFMKHKIRQFGFRLLAFIFAAFCSVIAVQMLTVKTVVQTEPIKSPKISIALSPRLTIVRAS